MHNHQGYGYEGHFASQLHQQSGLSGCLVFICLFIGYFCLRQNQLRQNLETENCSNFNFFSSIYSPPIGLGFNTLCVQYYSVICRPSDHTVGPRFEPGTGDLEARTLTTRPPHLLLDHHTSFNLVLFYVTYNYFLR